MYDATGPQPARPHWTEPDVLIVGAGASGAAVAWRLAEAGFRVVCLDQGDWVDPAALPAYGDDWELRRLTDFNPDPNVRQLPEDYPWLISAHQLLRRHGQEICRRSAPVCEACPLTEGCRWFRERRG